MEKRTPQGVKNTNPGEAVKASAQTPDKKSETRANIGSTPGASTAATSTPLGIFTDEYDTNPNDPSSFSRPDQVSVNQVRIQLHVDFRDKVLHGCVTLHAVRHKPEVKILILDTWNLNIKKLTSENTKAELEYKMYQSYGALGSKLEVYLPDKTSETYDITCQYDTSRKASALQWLRPEQTEGKKHPYLFTQCQTIHCRSMIPCQDTPSAKITYVAEVIAPKDMVVLMSAQKKEPVAILDDGNTVHTFEQIIPISSYLIALAVGDMTCRALGPRTVVWGEPSFVDKALYEFEETEKLLVAAESICGDYIWGTYDLLVLPSNFAYSAMENPGLTFLNPTLLVGDRTLVNVVAHEIAHSWTGNLVTNINFEHFWLNEGFSTFIERKILGIIHGSEYRLFAAFRGLKDLEGYLSNDRKTSPLTKLVVDLSNISPEETLSIIPYEKGHTFLYYLESLVGGPQEFDRFLRVYLETYRYKCLDSYQFKSFFCEYFSYCDSIKNVDWNAWLHDTGLPPIIPDYTTSLQKACVDLKEKWLAWKRRDPCTFSQKDLSQLDPLQVQEFLDQILNSKPLPLFKLKTMEECYKLHDASNTDTRFKWILLCVKGRWSDKIHPALDFVKDHGRLKYVILIYRALNAWEEARDLAIDCFRATKKNMMSTTARAVAKELHVNIDD